jgi:hypothetical protein
MILQDIVQTLTEAVTKCNHLLKYLRIFKGSFLFTEALTIVRVAKWIYGGRRFIYASCQILPVS